PSHRRSGQSTLAAWARYRVPPFRATRCCHTQRQLPTLYGDQSGERLSRFPVSNPVLRDFEELTTLHTSVARHRTCSSFMVCGARRSFAAQLRRIHVTFTRSSRPDRGADVSD